MFTQPQQPLQALPADYERALADFGIIDLRQKLIDLIGNDENPQVLDQLTTLLIRHLTSLVDLDCLDGFLHAIHQGQNAMISDCLSRVSKLPLPADSPSFFLDAQLPRFPFGSVLRWIPMDDCGLTDWGIVIGRYYGYAPESGRWMWCYLLLLDPDSTFCSVVCG